jgi:hypothetical protein
MPLLKRGNANPESTAEWFRACQLMTAIETVWPSILFLWNPTAPGSAGVWIAIENVRRVKPPAEPGAEFPTSSDNQETCMINQQRIATGLLIVLVTLSILDQSAAADTFGSGANTFDIEFVSIGNPGNAADTTGSPNPAGSVAYSYRMGKFEISEQMIDKANAEGGLGITKPIRGPDKPATSISWNEAARFVNWLNMSSDGMPAYKFAIQPGDVGYNANVNIELWTIGDAGYNPNNLYRNSLARYFLPSVDEWYKAAYFDPSGVYYNYPTGSDSVPDGIDFAGDTTLDAVFFQGAGSIPQPNDIANVGVLSPYGTAGQGGNVWELEETDFDLGNGPIHSSSGRGVRGGSWFNSSGGLQSSFRLGNSGDPTFGNDGDGFRVASSIPEPSTLLLLCFGSLALLWRR